jgi:sulfotransferase family protein
MKLAERMRARRQSWLPDSGFRSGEPKESASNLLRFLPPPQRDPVELAAWLDCSIAEVAAFRPRDVREDGIRLGRHFVAWPLAVPGRLREAVVALARATPPKMRIFESQKPLIRAASDLRAAFTQASRSASAAKTLSAAAVDAAAPDFLVLGVPRSATTWLYSALSTHPDVYLPKTKEQEFFGDYQFHLGWNWYLQHFAARGGQSVAGDVSVGYFHSPEAPGQIARMLGTERVKLIVVLREPIERARSYYNYRLIRGMMPATFEEAIAMPYFRDLFVEQGHYAGYLERWYDTFDRSRLLILLHDEIQTNPSAALMKMLRFLGISSEGFVVPQRENAGTRIVAIPMHRLLLRGAADLEVVLPSRAAPIGRWLARKLRNVDAKLCLRHGESYDVPIRPATERRLREEFAASNERLAQMTGLDLSAWSYAAVGDNRPRNAEASSRAAGRVTHPLAGFHEPTSKTI